MAEKNQITQYYGFNTDVTHIEKKQTKNVSVKHSICGIETSIKVKIKGQYRVSKGHLLNIHDNRTHT